MSIDVRDIVLSDAPAIAEIYNAAVAQGTATFDTELTTVAEIEADLSANLPTHPAIAVLRESRVVAYALSSPHSTYEPYRGIAEFSVYVADGHRGRGLGRTALSALIDRCQSTGFTKLLSRILTTNQASRHLCASLGFREVGIYERHAQINGKWCDVVIVEKILLPGNVDN